MNKDNINIQRRLNNYFLKNEISFKDEDALNHIHNVMHGGNDCAGNNNIFNWTMQTVNGNQRTISGEQLIGGRVSLPTNYFNANASFPSNDGASSVVMGDVTPTLIRPGLNSTFLTGGKPLISKKSFNTMLKQRKQRGGVDTKQLSGKDRHALYNIYNDNLNSFMENLDTLKGGRLPISKNKINRAFSSIKKN